MDSQLSSQTQVSELIKDLQIETVISFTSKAYLSMDELLMLEEFFNLVDNDGEVDVFVTIRVVNNITQYQYRITK